MWTLLLACRQPSPSHPQPRDSPATSDGLDIDELLPFEPHNLLMISIDTTRRDHIDRYAIDGISRSPFLSKLLSEGLALDDHQQCSNWTFGSTTCTLEGRLNEDTGWMAQLGPGTTPVPDGRRTLAARMSEQGFHTILVSSNAWLTEEWNNAQGYTATLREWTSLTADLLERGRRIVEVSREVGYDRFLLHVHLLQAHPPYNPPDPYDDPAELLPPLPDGIDIDDLGGHYSAIDHWPLLTPSDQQLLLRHLKARYTGEIRAQDDALAAWWEQMDAEGWLDDTLVVFWTDHGEQFFEHGEQAHAYTLAAEESDAVLGFWAKQLDPMAFSGPTHAVDLLPTVLDLMGLPPDPGEVFDGYVVGTAPEDRARFASSTSRLGPVVSVTKENLKLQYRADGTLQLWDRSVDREELVDLYTPEHPAVPELWALLRPRAELVAALRPDIEFVWP